MRSRSSMTEMNAHIFAIPYGFSIIGVTLGASPPVMMILDMKTEMRYKEESIRQRETGESNSRQKRSTADREKIGEGNLGL